jgi:hypothetical protein
MRQNIPGLSPSHARMISEQCNVLVGEEHQQGREMILIISYDEFGSYN